MKTTHFVLLPFILLLPYTTLAQLNDPGGTFFPIRTAGSSVLIPADARSAGMGATGVAAATDAEALFWNPAALSFSETKMGVTGQFMPWFTALGLPGTNRYAAAGFITLNNQPEKKHPISIGLSGRFLSLNQIDGLFSPDPTPEISRHELVLSTSVSVKISDHVAAGAMISYLDSRQSTVTNSKGPMNVLLGDLFVQAQHHSTLFQKPLEIRGGVVLGSLGPKVSYAPSLAEEFLSTNLAIGYALSLDLAPEHRLSLTQDARKLLVPSQVFSSDLSAWEGITASFSDSPEGFMGELRETSIGIGLEYVYKKWLSLRSGYTWVHPVQGDRRVITVGAGATLEDWSIDASFWIPTEINNPFQNTWSVGIGWSL